MLKDLSIVYDDTSAICRETPMRGISIDASFTVAYTQFVQRNAPVKGGFTSVIFDGSGATFRKSTRRSQQDTPVSSYAFVLAHKLLPLYCELREYQAKFFELFSDYDNDAKSDLATKLRENIDAEAIAVLNDRCAALEESERMAFVRFMTDYDWWHGGKTVDRDDFLNSPLLTCAHLVAASNGAVPSIAQHFAENVELAASFKFEVSTQNIVVHRNQINDNLNLDQLVQELQKMVGDPDTKSSGYRILGLKYPKSVELAGRQELLKKAGLSDSYEVELHKGIKLHQLIAANKWGLSFEQEDKKTPRCNDVLQTALKLFQSNRHDAEWQANVIRDSYLNVYEFAKPTAEELASMPIETFKSEVMDKVWAFQNGGVRKWGQLDDGEKAAYQKFVAEMRGGLKPFEAYFPPDKQCPRGMGVGVVSELLMRFYPTACCSYNKDLVWDALVTLGICEGEFEWPKKASIYQDFMGKCATVLRRMEEMKLARTPKEGDQDAPDYITVNEFFWFVHDYKDLIQREILEGMKMKVAKHDPIPDAEKNRKPKVKMTDADDVLLLRLRAALRTKPFAILAGHSGTGKSRMVRKLAYMTCGDDDLRKDEKGNPAKDPGNFCMIQVRPNWHDSSDLLGYYSEMGKQYRASEFIKFICKAYAYPKVPFFVCLDEMNLAPVEQYFAEYLSAIESRTLDGEDVLTDELVPEFIYCEGVGEKRTIRYDWLGCEYEDSKAWIKKNGITIPRNLFVVGTVNMDESTNQFSRKVLDRAMTIEMTDADFDSFGKKKVELSFDDYMGDAAVADLIAGEVQAKTLTDDQKDKLNALKEVLKSTSFAVAYRFANEYALYEDSLNAVMDAAKSEIDDKVPDGADVKKWPAKPSAFDDMVLMKVLPRISGDKEDVERIFFGEGGSREKPKEKTLVKLLGEAKDTGSIRKIDDIIARGGSYLSFWP